MQNANVDAGLDRLWKFLLNTPKLLIYLLNFIITRFSIPDEIKQNAVHYFAINVTSISLVILIPQLSRPILSVLSIYNQSKAGSTKLK